MKTIIFILFLYQSLLANNIFLDYFVEKSLRFDFYHIGNDSSESIVFDEMVEEPIWGGRRVNLVDTLNFGSYKFTISDIETKSIIYSQGFSTLFGEWRTTLEAKELTRSFSGSVVFPYPNNPILLEIHSRNKNNIFEKIFSFEISPNNYFIKKKTEHIYEVDTIWYSGNAANKYDIVFIPEAYTEDNIDKFLSDCDTLANYLFKYQPFNELKSKINIWAVKAPSADSLCDIPADGHWYNTLLNTSYYTFDSERYIMTTDFKRVRDVASNAPYDQIYILANSKKYGGGAIYNHYSLTVTNNPKFKQIFIHELGHGIAGLADEYGYDDTFDEFYQKDVEPWERNITTLVNFNEKWKYFVEEDTPIPTPNESDFYDKVGIFEGAGYVNEGVYRSSYNSIMRSLNSDGFNKVSQLALKDAILFYSK